MQSNPFLLKWYPLLQKENKLTSDYSKLVASAQIEFDGKTLTLAQLAPYAESTDREIRKSAMETSYHFMQKTGKNSMRFMMNSSNCAMKLQQN